MNKKRTVTVTLPADVQQLDTTGYVWAFLDTAPPSPIGSGSAR